MLLRPLSQRSRSLSNPGRWRQRAACRGMGPEPFFPRGEAEEEAAHQVAAAKSVCAGCHVRLHCLTYALAAHVDHGVWGGLTPSERAGLRRSRRLRRPGRGASTSSWPR